MNLALSIGINGASEIKKLVFIDYYFSERIIFRKQTLSRKTE